MVIGRLLSYVPVLAILPAISGLAVAEAEYAFIALMPAVIGTLVQSRLHVDRAAGLVAKKEVFVAERPEIAYRTHVVRVGCARLAVDALPFIIAYQYGPKEPKSQAAAGRSALFLEVFVRDRDGCIRAYQERDGRAMAGSTRKYQPDCAGI